MLIKVLNLVYLLNPFGSPSIKHHGLRRSGLGSVNNCLLTVGGYDDGLKPQSSVHLYDCYKKTWSKVSDIRNRGWWPAVVVSTFERTNRNFCTW